MQISSVRRKQLRLFVLGIVVMLCYILHLVWKLGAGIWSTGKTNIQGFPRNKLRVAHKMSSPGYTGEEKRTMTR